MKFYFSISKLANLKKKGIRDVFREMLREEGHRALFRGFVPVMLCAFHANAACFSGLELTLWAFRQAGI
ncbi:hypothetical protein niasHT_021863 [Heterodera trifolii]|uniref:Uncharacterized protein n=1 Tax=Heterodera trifolii TaxID=157864 RepID=A0ABD2JC69_9BILA